MHRHTHMSAVVLLSIVILTACVRSAESVAPSPSPAALPPPGRGINLGNALEASWEGEWDMVLQEEYFELIRNAGFDTVRIPIRWSSHADSQPPYTIEPAFFDRVDWAVEQALSRGLIAVINMHHYEALMARPDAHRERFLAMWRQIAEHYRHHPPTLYFEILNEPNGYLTPSLWNEYLREALAVIRESNPERTVVIGTAEWGGLRGLNSLSVPEDEHLIMTFHYYEPFQFTHQGTEWVNGSSRWLGTKWRGTKREKEAVRRHMDAAAAWGREHGLPVWMGEFGAYSKADQRSRVRWTSFVVREAEARGIAWAYWEFGAGFGVYDREAGRWRDDLLNALIPTE
ncbi:MAG: glycoside hydrolase family 5 protein [Anaerolineae bacterium]|jgi:endoglucanase